MKKFLICLSLLFSLLFIGNIKALDLSSWEDISTFTLPSGITPENYKIIIRKGSSKYIMTVIPKNNNARFQIFRDSDIFPNAYAIKNLNSDDSSYYASWYQADNSKVFQYRGTNNFAQNFDYKIVYTNADIYSTNGTDKWFSKDTLTAHTFNFHLNGGYVYDDRAGFEFENWDDFSFTLYGDEIEDFFTNLKVEKATMIFEGWYYDTNFNNPFNITDNITSDVDLYAKFRYEKVDDFLNNTNFTEYTFDTLYNYAIITKGNNSGDIYLGINSNRYDITVYEYIENLSNYDNEKGFCLVPIYSKNGTYYYLLDTTKTLNTEVLVLPKSTFENNDYKFLLTDNAYVTYTNNLEETTIYDSNGNQINTNLEETYQRFQDSMISEENDLLTIFKNLTGLKDNNIFNNINSLWNKFKATPIYNFLMILIVGSLIILIIKSAKRK